LFFIDCASFNCRQWRWAITRAAFELVFADAGGLAATSGHFVKPLLRLTPGENRVFDSVAIPVSHAHGW
jgi:hypothetical protein